MFERATDRRTVTPFEQGKWPTAGQLLDRYHPVMCKGGPWRFPSGFVWLASVAGDTPETTAVCSSPPRRALSTQGMEIRPNRKGLDSDGETTFDRLGPDHSDTRRSRG